MNEMAIEEKVVLTGRCQSCRGQGQVVKPHCQRCGFQLGEDDPWWEGNDQPMPCGHLAAEHLVETVVCPECQGAGQSERWLTLSEWRAFQLRKWIRAAFVLLSTGLLLAVLLVVIWSTPLNESICGSWWYGAIPLVLLVRGIRCKEYRD